MLYLILGGMLLTIGDIVFKYWLTDSKVILYVLGLSLYVLGLVCLVQSFKIKNIAVASAIFVIVNITTLAIVSSIFFNESLTIKQIVGILLSFIVVLILE